MDTIKFLRRVLAADGHYCLWVFHRGTGRKTQKFYTTITELADAALDYDRQGWDAYFGTATFVTDYDRTADNAKSLRTFFLDLDCGEGKEYPDQITAIQTLQNFCMRMALPKPLLVNSGRGVHVYWVMDRDLSRTEWQSIAGKLKAATKQHKFPMDPVVVANAAQILRVPGTHNHKDTPPSPVTVLQQSGSNTVKVEDFASKFGEIVVAPRTFIPMKHRAVTDRLLGNHSNSFKMILTRAEGCAQIMQAVTNQAEASEPLWRATLSIAAYCEDSDKAIHAVSKDHPEYDPDITQQKAERIKGPYLCDRFDDYNPGVCANCPHFGKIKSPIVLGRELKAAETEEERTVEVPKPMQAEGVVETVVVPKPPDPYIRGVNGGVYKHGVDEDGDPDDMLIYHHDLYVTRRVFDRDIGDSVVIRLHLPQDGVREFSVPQSAINAMDKLREALSAKGVTARSKKQWENIGYYIMDYVDHLQAKESADMSHRQFGWTKDMKSFVLGDHEYFPGRVRHNPATKQTRALAEYMEPRGTLERWKEMMQFYNHAGMELHQLIISSAFGAPLMEFTAINAMLMHLDGPTGFGKSTTQLAAAGVYGKPDGLMIKHDDTMASTFNRFEVMKNLPVYIDELTNCNPADASTIAYSLSAGRQRMRMAGGSNEERTRGEPWFLTAVSSGNASMMSILESNKAQPDAERERVFEINITDYIYPHSKKVADEFQNAINTEAYGVAGPVYIEWLVNNQEEAAKFLKTTQERLDAVTGLSSKNRMVSASLAAYLAGGMIAKRLGLIDFDMKRVFDLVVDLIRERLDYFEGNTRGSLEYLTQYITENWNNVLRINSTQRAGGGDNLTDEFVVPDATPKGALIARWEPDTHNLFLIPRPFQKWCVEQQLNAKGLLADVSKTNTVQYKKVRIDKGTKLNLSPINAYVVNLPIQEPDDASATD